MIHKKEKINQNSNKNLKTKEYSNNSKNVLPDACCFIFSANKIQNLNYYNLFSMMEQIVQPQENISQNIDNFEFAISKNNENLFTNQKLSEKEFSFIDKNKESNIYSSIKGGNNIYIQMKKKNSQIEVVELANETAKNIARNITIVSSKINNKKGIFQLKRDFPRVFNKNAKRNFSIPIKNIQLSSNKKELNVIETGIKKSSFQEINLYESLKNINKDITIPFSPPLNSHDNINVIRKSRNKEK